VSYTELKTKEEIEEAAKMSNAWQDASIPQKQWDISVAKELVKIDEGKYYEVPPFRAFADSLYPIRKEPINNVLEVGASSGYYGYLMDKLGYGHYDYKWEYTALDYSKAFKKFAEEKFPGIKFDIGDALNLPYNDCWFDLVISGCCMIHLFDWKRAIREAVRVSKKYVMFHRTPLLTNTTTKFFTKEAYDVPCLEIWFGMQEFYKELEKNCLRVINRNIVFEYQHQEFGTYGHYAIMTVKL